MSCSKDLDPKKKPKKRTSSDNVGGAFIHNWLAQGAKKKQRLDDEQTAESSRQVEEPSTTTQPASIVKPSTTTPASIAEAEHPCIGKKEVLTLLTEQFGDDPTDIHNYYLCHKRNCTGLSFEQKWKDKFNYKWLFEKSCAYSPTTGIWCLAFAEKAERRGQYCLLCRKHKAINHRNKSPVWGQKPSVRYKKSAVEGHMSSGQHKGAVTDEQTQRVSKFHEEFEEIKETKTTVLENAFYSAYFLMEESIANRKLIPLIELMKDIGLDSMEHFNYSGQGTLRKMFLTIGDTIKEMVTDNVRKAGAYGLMVDDMSDCAVLEQMISFIQFFNKDLGKVQTMFLSIDNVHAGANAEALFQTICDMIDECNLQIEKLKGFCSDGASVMIGKLNGLAAKLRTVSNLMINIHCVCHRLALACCSAIKELERITSAETILHQLWYLFENSPKNSIVHEGTAQHQ